MKGKPSSRKTRQRKALPRTLRDAFGPLAAHVVDDAAQQNGARRTKRRGSSANREEARQQKKFVLWARQRGLELNHQNNGASTKARRIHLHQMGCTAGAADVLVFDRLPKLPDARGLALEFKGPSGEPTPAQVAWKNRLSALGWAYHVVRTADDARTICLWYGL